MRMQESKGKYFLRTMCIIHIAVCKVVGSQINISLNFSESCCFTCVLFFSCFLHIISILRTRLYKIQQ